MEFELFIDTCNWFQVGWNMAIKNPRILAHSGLVRWDLYEFLAGAAAATHRRNLPGHWLR